MNPLAHEISLLLHFFAFLYGLYLFILIQAWYISKNSERTREREKESFSIIIPFRNEENTLQNLLNDLENQEFDTSLEKIIFVNDHSSDNSIELLNSINSKLAIEVIHLGNLEKGKKEGVRKAWKQIEADWIIQLDADIRLKPNWFQTLSENYDSESYLCILPIHFNGKTFIQKLFAFEFLSISMLTYATAGLNQHTMANAAHLMYRNDSLDAITETRVWNKTASGDDTSLLKYFKNQGKKISCILLEELIVSTQAEESLKSNLSQRLRWAAKSKGEPFSFSGLNALFFFFSNLIFVFASFELLSASSVILRASLIFILTKIIADFCFFLPVIQFYKKENWLIFYFFLIPIYPLYIVLLGILSIIGKGKWKGRQIKLN